MGAPGHYILCPKGHEIGVIEDDLYWDDEMFKRLEELENKKCPICGQKAKYNFCHYGDIDDCTDVKLVWNSKEKRWIIPKKLEERQKRDLKDHIIKKDRAIKTKKADKKVAVAEKIKINRVRIVESKNGRDGGENEVLATFPRNEGSGITIERDCRVDVEIDGKWHKIWELRISSKYQRCDMKCDV